MFQPHHINSVLVRFLYSQMDHGVPRISPVPVTFPRFNPNRIPRSNNLRPLARELHPPDSRQHMQSLPHRMRMPSRARPRFERNAIHRKSRRRGSGDNLINPHRASEPTLRPLAAAAHLVSKYFHFFFRNSLSSFRVLTRTYDNFPGVNKAVISITSR
jgi:hypothetical protein